MTIVIQSCNKQTKTLQTTDKPTALTGIFTNKQVESVVDLYTNACAPCHGKDFRGSEFGNALIGNRFQEKWKEKSLGEFFQYTKSTMPITNPGAYDDETYTSLIAFILNANNFPTGSKALSSNKEELDKIIFGLPLPS